MKNFSGEFSGEEDEGLVQRRCYCGYICRIWMCKQGRNKGLEFYGCPRYKGPNCKGCDFFEWVDDTKNITKRLEKLEKNVEVSNKMLKDVILYLKVVIIVVLILLLCVVAK